MSRKAPEAVATALGLQQAGSRTGISNDARWPGLVASAIDRLIKHGLFEDWWQIISELPPGSVRETELNQDVPTAWGELPLVRELLLKLSPWKKGPFRIGETFVDSEWQSHLKWNRLRDIASSFRGRTVLDVGTGNGYFLLRSAGAGAAFTMGIEPSALSCAQFLGLKRCFACQDIALLPTTCEEFLVGIRAFDSVLSLGVLYHRRSPLDHLLELKSFCKSGGELILETIVVDGPPGYSLVPRERYAKMRNVWFLPSPATVVSWLDRVGFVNVRFTDPIATTSIEQRSTAWARSPSLADFLDEADETRTIEGYPAPKRAIFVATAP